MGCLSCSSLASVFTGAVCSTPAIITSLRPASHALSRGTQASTAGECKSHHEREQAVVLAAFGSECRGPGKLKSSPTSFAYAIQFLLRDHRLSELSLDAG